MIHFSLSRTGVTRQVRAWGISDDSIFPAPRRHYRAGQGMYMRELPKGSAICMIDEDDPAVMKKEIGDLVTICGGVTLGTLRTASKEKCLDAATRALIVGQLTNTIIKS